MKKLLLTTALVAIFAFGVSAQEQGDIRVSAGLALGTKSALDDNGSTKMGMGLNIGAEYLISDAIGIAPSYDYFFKSEVAGGAISTQASSINIDGRYYFGDGKFYGLAGISLARAKATANVGGFSAEATSSSTGLNIGAGAMIPMGDTMFINGQVKYNTPLEQIGIQAGIAFAF